MNPSNDLLSSIIHWAEKEEPVRALVLVGSRAQPEQTDDLADFDIRLFTRNHEKYVEDDQWLSRIGKLWLYVPDQYDEAGEVVPTRLAIYDHGIKVDFAFYKTVTLPKLRWTGGYHLLLDKDELRAQIKSALPDKASVLSEKEFVSLCNEFWFETYHVAKYLNREELWLVKFRDWSAKTFLLRMLEWYEQASHNWNYETYWMGTKMHAWLSPGIWENLHRTFAHFDREDSWECLLNTIQLFRTISSQLAARMNFAYPTDVDENITRFILPLQKSSE